MNIDHVSKSYSLALLEISKETGVKIKSDLDKVWELIRGSNDLESLLFLDIFTVEERKSVVTELLSKIDLNDVTKNFIFFLLDNKRFNLFPNIYTSLVMEEDLADGFITGTIEGNEETPDQEVIEKLKSYLEKDLKQIAKLNYVKNENISAGYKITAGDLQLDATLENQFDRLRKNILAN